MNRLKGTKTYLIGGIDRAPDNGATWRDRITPFLEELGVIVINPLKKPCDIGIEDNLARSDIQRMKEEGCFDEIRPKYKNIRNVDLRFCDLSDWVIARIDISFQLCGTIEEISLCNRSKKPVLIWCPDGKAKCPSWLYLMLPHQLFFETYEELCNYILHINSDENIDTLERWFFLDFSLVK